MGGRGVRSIRTDVGGKDDSCIDSTVALTCEIGPGAGILGRVPLRCIANASDMDRLFDDDGYAESETSVSETITLGKSPDSVRRCGTITVSLLGEVEMLALVTGDVLPLSPRSSPSSDVRSTVRLSRALTRSSARVSRLGGSSRIDSHPTGGEPGGEMRKFLSVWGTSRRSRRRRLRTISMGVGIPR